MNFVWAFGPIFLFQLHVSLCVRCRFSGFTLENDEDFFSSGSGGKEGPGWETISWSSVS
jgi:hypothetical protein